MLLMCRWDIGIGSIAKRSGQLSIAGQYCELSRHLSSIAMLVLLTHDCVYLLVCYKL